jgi:hypothetical protein
VNITVPCKKRKKETKLGQVSKNKQTVRSTNSSDNSKIIWAFDNLDNDGCFKFDVSREDFEHQEVLDKIIKYSSMTWREILQQTHDGGKSKHHFLRYESLSGEAQMRLQSKKLEEASDSIFSFALTNLLRIIGIRDKEKFHVLWYDPEHKVCPSKRR